MSNIVVGYTEQVQAYQQATYSDSGICPRCGPFWDSLPFNGNTSSTTCPNQAQGASYPTTIGYCGGLGCATTNCTSRILACSNVDPGYCNNRGIATATNVRFARQNLGDPFNPPWVRCQYNLSDVTTLNSVNNWINTFGKNDDWYNKIMPQFCFRDSGSCPPNPSTGQIEERCPIARSIGANGELCRQWEEEILERNPTLLETSIQAYCNRSENSLKVACQCQRRDLYPGFTEIIQNTAGVPFQCWYQPCVDKQYYLITPTDLNPDLNRCPSNVCAQIVELASEGSISTDLQQNINCTFAGSQTAEFQSLFIEDKREAAVRSANNINTEWYRWLIVGFIILIILAIVILIVYLFMGSSNNAVVVEENTVIT